MPFLAVALIAAAGMAIGVVARMLLGWLGDVRREARRRQIILNNDWYDSRVNPAGRPTKLASLGGLRRR